MTFEEWWEREDRVYLNEYSTFKMVALQAWNHQQKRIDELESQLEDATMFHYKRGFQDAKEIHMRKNVDLLANIEVLQAQLEVADIRPMGEDEYRKKIEKLEWDLGDVENALNNMKQLNKHLRNNIAETQEKLDIERNRTEELEEQVEWHKRRAEGWRSIAVLEEQGK